MTTPFDGIAPLPHLGVIRAEGEDAVKFLHGQLTHDFALLDLQHARLAAFLSAKGRMQASFIGFKRSPTEVLLVCSRDLLAPTLKRMSMFVMRAKARLSDASEEFLLYGLAGSAIEKVAGSAIQASAKADLGNISVVGLVPAGAVPRALWIAPAGTPAPEGSLLPDTLWTWGEVQSGVATLTAPLVDAFVPQMLNYESVDGVSFKKGCYPGQEIVARSQFRGAIKRRAFIVHADVSLQVGAEVFNASEPEQACGIVAQAAPAPGGGWDAIVVLQLAAAESGALHADSAEGPALRLGSLPYALKDDL
ncbi:YgfZ/GcvT domain-containing protein [Simplicispira suum]|uniref:Folate-binding protein YgfZ n=1 Tax=Simplicispira suum TaxID=2109915 RepID=A0A2S0N411_9BURK|nr:folate-binding protein YgfZ [Simplicispira suum]AVO42681.1 folate-binding protein YgfZ [Simplicispira suum]